MLALFLFLLSPEPPRIEASSLAAVPGPLVPKGPDAGLDPAGNPIQSQLRRGSRRAGSIPAVAVPSGPIIIQDQMIQPIPGWKAYRVEAPAHGTVKVRLRGLHEAWFKVSCMNRWGLAEAGMLQNNIPTGNPEASYRNPKGVPTTVWFVVDLQELNAPKEAYTLEFSHLPKTP